MLKLVFNVVWKMLSLRSLNRRSWTLVTLPRMQEHTHSCKATFSGAQHRRTSSNTQEHGATESSFAC